jgi:hypothetical protein
MTITACRSILVCLVLIAGLTASDDEFIRKRHEPWKNDRNALIFDAYAQNPIEWETLVQEPRVAGIIHKATEGFSIDAGYAERKTEAKKRGY